MGLGEWSGERACNRRVVWNGLKREVDSREERGVESTGMLGSGIKRGGKVAWILPGSKLVSLGFYWFVCGACGACFCQHVRANFCTSGEASARVLGISAQRSGLECSSVLPGQLLQRLACFNSKEAG